MSIYRIDIILWKFQTNWKGYNNEHYVLQGSSTYTYTDDILDHTALTIPNVQSTMSVSTYYTMLLVYFKAG